MPLEAYLPRADDEFVVALEAVPRLPGVNLVTGDMPSNPSFDVLVAGRPTEEELCSSERLRCVIVPFAGIPPATLEKLRVHSQLELYNLHHNAEQTAELALSLMLAVGKKLLPMDRALRENDWRPRYAKNNALMFSGRKVVVVGYGAIGRHLASVCQSLGMDVVAVSRSGRCGGDIAVVSWQGLKDLLPRAEVVLLAVPSTEETRGLLGREELSLLPRDAVLVNVSRGPVIDEQALFETLRDGRIAGAGLDVWYHYPEDEESRADTAPSAFPFASLDNVVLSPHRAGHCVESEELRARHLLKLLASMESGEPTSGNRIDLSLGY